MGFTDPTFVTNTIQSLADQPTETASEVKQAFDKAAADIKTYLTALNDELEATTDGNSGMDNIGMTPIDGVMTTPQQALEYLKTRADATQPTLNIDSVLDYGAVGDGIADDSEAINTAIASNRFVWLPSGTYKVNSTVLLSGLSNVALVFAKGAKLLQGSADIDIIKIDSCTNVTVLGAEIEGIAGTSKGTAGTNKGIYVTSCTDIEIKDVNLHGMYSIGVHAYNVDGILIEESTIANTGERNTSVDTPWNSGNFVAGMFSPIFINGDGSNPSKNVKIRYNEIYGCLNTAVSVIAANDGNTVIEYNEIYDSDSNGVQTGTGTTRTVIQFNDIHDLTGLYDPTVEGYAISFHDGCDNSVIKNNYIENCKLAGINTKASDNTQIFDNYLFAPNENGTLGAILTWGENCKIKNNEVLDCYFTAIESSNVDSDIEGNTISHNAASLNKNAIRVSTTYNGGANNVKVKGNKSLTTGLLLSYVTADFISMENQNMAIFTSNADGEVINDQLVQYVSDTYGLRITGTSNVTVQGGTNKAANKYQNFGTGDLYIEMPTRDYRKEVYGSAAPTSGTWVQGDRVYDETPSASGNIGWVCTTGGTPGTWKTFGTISA